MSLRALLFCSLATALQASAVDFSTQQDVQKEASNVAPSPCCGAAIVPGGHFEVEMNYSGDGVNGEFVHTSNLTLKYSLTDRVQLQLSTANLFVGGGSVAARAFDGVSPGLKLVFFDETERLPQLAASIHGVFPTLTIDDALQSTIDVYAMVYASKDLGPIHLDVTANLTVADLGATPITQGGASITATWNFVDRWGIATGPYSSFGNADKLPVDGGWFMGLNFSPLPELALTAGAEVGFFQDTRNFSLFTGIAWVPTARARVPLARSNTVAPDMVASR